jgi:hypothetical protein
MVLPYDAAWFMLMQRYVASALRLKTGAYHHFAGSLHIYEDELPLARSIVTDRDAEPVRMSDLTDLYGSTSSLTKVEHRLRNAVQNDDRVALEEIGQDVSKWESGVKDIAMVLCSYAAQSIEDDEKKGRFDSELPQDLRNVLVSRRATRTACS